METWRKVLRNTRSVSGNHGGKRYLETNRASDPETELEEKGDQDLKRSKMGSETLGKTLRDTGDCGELNSPLDGSP